MSERVQTDRPGMAPPKAADGELRSGDRVVPRRRLFHHANCVATGFAETGAVEGGAIALLLRNDLPFIECMLAAATAGAYCVPINWHYTAEEVRFILDDVRPSHLIVHADLLEPVRAVIPPDTQVIIVETPLEVRAAFDISAERAAVPADGTAWDAWASRWPAWAGDVRPLRGSMIYTSGTTGRPKAVRRAPIPVEARESYAKLRADWFGFRPGLRTAIIGPLYHSVQATYAYAALQAGGSILLEPRFDAAALLALIERERLTHLHLVPTMMHRLVSLPAEVRARFDLSSLEFVIHGAAPCPPDVKRRLIAWWGPIVHEYYGTSETGMVSRSDSHEWLQRIGTVGRPWPGRVIRVYDEAGAPVPAGTEGLVYMSLGMVPDFTYHGADDHRARIERDGLVTTGDIGYVDEEGYLFLCDRRQDVVISGGVKIWPAEVEAVLAEHPDVADSAVFGVPDAEYGQVPAAVVQAVEGAAVSPEALRQYLKSRLASLKVPRTIEIRETLPRDDSGKIYRRLLRDAFTARRGAP